MSRIVFLPTPGDPFLLRYWMRFFKRWESEVDRLCISLNTYGSPESVEAIRTMAAAASPKAEIYYVDGQIEHGDAINDLLLLSKVEENEDSIMLVEDDGFVFRAGIVDECFKQLELGLADVIGSKRGSCAMEIIETASARWGIPIEGYGDQGCNFWPNFFFTQRSLLEKTDRNFAAKHWDKGEYIAPLDHTLWEEANGDTFVWASLQLRGMVHPSRIRYVNQYHLNTFDIDDADRGENVFNNVAPWFHVGSLSSGWSGVIRDEHNRPLAKAWNTEPKEVWNLPPWANTQDEKQEWERRITFWQLAVEDSPMDYLPELRAEYLKGLDRVIQYFHLNEARIIKRKVMYNRLIGALPTL